MSILDAAALWLLASFLVIVAPLWRAAVVERREATEAVDTTNVVALYDPDCPDCFGTGIVIEDGPEYPHAPWDEPSFHTCDCVADGPYPVKTETPASASGRGSWTTTSNGGSQWP